jgi:hypothetical protein
LRAISEPVVKAAFNQTDRKAATVERLYERVQARLLAEPERYWFRYILVAALLTRSATPSEPGLMAAPNHQPARHSRAS